MFVSIIAHGYFLGQSEGLMTIVSQCKGRDNYEKANQALNKALFVNIVLLLPLIMVFMCMESILLFIG